MGEKESNECNVGEVGEKVREKNGNGGSISMDQDMSTLVIAPKILNFDLNELPPPKKRNSNKIINKRVLLGCEFSNNGDHVECDSDDSCDEDDYHTILLRKKLRSDGLIRTPHRICWTRRELICKICNESFKTYNEAFHHANEEVEEEVDDERLEGEGENFVGVYEEQEKGEDALGVNNQGMGEKQSNECNVREVGEEVREKNGNGGSISEDQDMSTLFIAPKILNFDLNELAPLEMSRDVNFYIDPCIYNLCT